MDDIYIQGDYSQSYAGSDGEDYESYGDMYYVGKNKKELENGN